MTDRKISVTCEIVRITPAMAAEWLEYNTGNFRPVTSQRVACYASDIRKGQWDLNGETIVFGISGELQNGQHRLAAVVAADKSIWCVVVRGVTCSAKHIDRGQPRRVSQWIAKSGIKNASIVAAVARKCVGYNKGLWTRKGWGVADVTDSEVIDFAESHSDAIGSSIAGSRMCGLPVSDTVAVMFLGCSLNDINTSQTARWFRDGLVQGSELSEMDAVLHLRNRIAASTATSKITPFMCRMLLTLAWNKTVAGEECSHGGLRIRAAGPAKQKLPGSIALVDDIDE